jgi:hypothetical protein
MPRIYANITNGLAYPHHEVAHFMSTHGHSCKFGYFRLDAMPYSAVIELLNGRPIRVVDATQHNKPLTDGLKYGLTTWVLVFNRGIRQPIDFREVAPWATKEMAKAALFSKQSKQLVQRIRRLQTIYGDQGSVRIGPGQLVEVECHRNFRLDDKPEQLRAFLASPMHSFSHEAILIGGSDGRFQGRQGAEVALLRQGWGVAAPLQARRGECSWNFVQQSSHRR